MDLHFRDAGLTIKDLNSIIQTLQSVNNDGSHLRSFSVSYNPALGDSGVISLLAALPLSVTEIGIVGCGLGDKSGQFLWEWARGHKSLRMICAEGNNFSAPMRHQLANLKNIGTNPSVYL